MNGGSLDDALGKYQEVIRLNRKRNSEEMDSDASAIIASKETCTPIAVAVSSLPSAFE